MPTFVLDSVYSVFSYLSIYLSIYFLSIKK